ETVQQLRSLPHRVAVLEREPDGEEHEKPVEVVNVGGFELEPGDEDRSDDDVEHEQRFGGDCQDPHPPAPPARHPPHDQAHDARDPVGDHRSEPDDVVGVEQERFDRRLPRPRGRRQGAESPAASAEKEVTAALSSPRRRFLSTLPAGLRGKGSSRSSTYSGTLKLARRDAQCPRSSSTVALEPGFSCTTALTSSPSTLWGTPTTAASMTSGCSKSS